MLNDDRLLDEVKKELAERKEKGTGNPRPELRGYTRQAKLITAVQTAIVNLHRSQTRNFSIPLPEEPIYPAERIELEAKAEEVDTLWTSVFAAMKNPGR